VRYVVDTNIAIAMLAQRQPVVDRLSNVGPGDLGLSVLVIAELLFGARRSARLCENVARVQALEAQFPVLISSVFDGRSSRSTQERSGLSVPPPPTGVQ